jgi:hypothetical protein
MYFTCFTDYVKICIMWILTCRSQYPRDLRCRSAADRLLRSWVQITPWAWIFVCCECRVLSGRGLWHVLITRPEEFYRLCCVVVCDLETSRIGAPYIYIYIYIYDISNLRVNFFSWLDFLVLSQVMCDAVIMNCVTEMKLCLNGTD